MKRLLLSLFLFVPFLVQSQSNNHWTRNFNEESSLLSGAVVGGGAGPSAIYYNPSSISEIQESKISLHASLFSFEFINLKNALGEGIDLNYNRGVIIPRFISYMIKPKKSKKWSFEVAFLNNENYKLEFNESVDGLIDVLENLPGIERYYSYFDYKQSYRDDWIGFGGAYEISPRLIVGASMFVSIKTLDYSYSLQSEAYPLDSVFIEDEYIPFYAASYNNAQYLHYNDYRLLWKIGFLYKFRKLSIGLNFTTPSLGGIYSDGKRVMNRRTQSNITNPETGDPLPNYFVADFRKKKDVVVNSKSAFSVAAGATYYLLDKRKILYFTCEYFAGIDSYKMIEANDNPNMAGGSIFGDADFSNWLTFVNGAKPVFNVAGGYQWQVKEKFMVLAGFRTDFNHRKNLDLDFDDYSNKVNGLDLDMYHFTGGVSITVFGQDIIMGIQYSMGREANKEQFVNLSSPVEFNPETNLPLQGTPYNTMVSMKNSLSVYFGATFNFGTNLK